MRPIVALFAAFAALAAVPAHARTVTVVETVTVEDAGSAERFVSGVPLESVAGIATYGPFRVTDATHAALVGITDEQSPREFAAMLRDYPALAELDMLECPGTFDDRANLALGRMIRRAGLETHVPADGSVRSGAVELFLAGAHRSIDDGARFAVHAWEDEDGLQATDYPADAPDNTKYLAYYRDMGMSADQAAAFYAMTNSVPNEQARWLSAADMRFWVPTEHAPLAAAPQLAYLDLSGLLN
jgi:hypothetical protein